MAEQYEGLDEAALNELLEKAETYEERSGIRKAIRALKGSSKAKKHVGSSNYRRAGWQAPKNVTIPNSVTNNVLPTRVNVTDNKLEKPETKSTISYLKSKETPYGDQKRRKSGGTIVKGSSPRESPRESISSYTSVTPEPNELAEPEKAPEVVKAESFEEVMSPEPPREPTPEPPREPTPEPPRDPTPEPVQSPTPPPRSPTPEPPREPSPEPIREPSPEPVQEPSPEPEPSPELDEADAADDSVESEGEEEASEGEESEGEIYDEDDDEEDAEEKVRGSRTGRSSDAHQYRGGRSTYDTSKVGAKTSVPIDILSKKEDGIDGDFRRKLRKADETKIDTTKAFPQAKSMGEQVDFRNVLRKTAGIEKKDIKSGARAQNDFRSSLKGRPASVKPKPSRRQEEPEQQAVEEPIPEPIESEPVESESVESEPVEPEEPEEPKPKESEPVEPEPETVCEEPKEQVDAAPEPDSYESRMAERRRRRADRSREMEKVELVKTEDKKPAENGVEEDSYEARREARRKAREERLKAAAATDDKPHMSYRERKALEAKKQMENARDSRNKWSSMEEESGEKAEAKGANFKKKDSATAQLLAWCQHKTRYYENVDVKDFRSSWADGMAFCAIIHSFLPDKIPYDELSPSDPRTNFTIAFEAAKEAGIPEMLDVEDMLLVKVPDAKSIMTFLVTIYQHFN